MSLNSIMSAAEEQEHLDKLVEFAGTNTPLFVLTGAGCSTDSGIPDYRDHNGNWKNSQPVQYQDFLSRESVRKRYWARSMMGWPRIHAARPNPAHHALARLEGAGIIHQLVTQNVDGLHRRAGSRRVLDLHGDLDYVICINCRRRTPRVQLQKILLHDNSGFAAVDYQAAPDGDAATDITDYGAFKSPACDACNGILKPDVVFFGESVPNERVEQAIQKLRESKAIMVIGSSLMVFSGYRFVRKAWKYNMPSAAINMGKTRADKLFTLKFELPCAGVLDKLSRQLADSKTVKDNTGPNVGTDYRTENRPVYRHR